MSDRARPASRGALDLLPFMNLVTLLIPLLLVASQLAELAVIDSVAPPIIADGTPAPGGPPVQLRLEIAPAALTLRGAESILGEAPRIACQPGCAAVDPAALGRLQELLQQVKAARPDLEELTFAPGARIPFSAVVAVLDASREVAGQPLFPTARFAG